MILLALITSFLLTGPALACHTTEGLFDPFHDCGQAPVVYQSDVPCLAKMEAAMRSREAITYHRVYMEPDGDPHWGERLKQQILDDQALWDKTKHACWRQP